MEEREQARKRNPELPAYWEVREVSYERQGRLKPVLTSLPAEHYSAKAIADLYRERFEIELGFRDIKSSLPQSAITLRSKKIELIYQEVWGLLLSSNVASQAAVAFAAPHPRYASSR